MRNIFTILCFGIMIVSTWSCSQTKPNTAPVGGSKVPKPAPTPKECSDLLQDTCTATAIVDKKCLWKDGACKEGEVLPPAPKECNELSADDCAKSQALINKACVLS